MILTNGLPLTKTEKRFLDLFQDGLPHARPELHRLLWDEQSMAKSINCHICRLRKKLKNDLNIICEYYKRNLYFRMVRLIGVAKKIKGLQASA